MAFAAPDRLTDRAAIDAYGDGGFRIGGVRCAGSVLILPQGVHAWPVAALADLAPHHLRPVLDLAAGLDFVLLGTGRRYDFHDPGVAAACAAAGLGLEAMDTGAACRTYNVLLAEGRDFAAALIAV